MSSISFGKGLKADQLINSLRESKLLDKPLIVTFRDIEHALLIEWIGKEK